MIAGGDSGLDISAGVDAQLDVVAHQSGLVLSAAVIGDNDNIIADAQSVQSTQAVSHVAVVAAGVADLHGAGVSLDVLQSLFQSGPAALGVGDQHVEVINDTADGLQLVPQLHIGGAAQRVGNNIHGVVSQDGIAVILGVERLHSAGEAGSAFHVHSNQLLVVGELNVLHDLTGQDIRAAAGRIGDDDGDGAVG